MSAARNIPLHLSFEISQANDPGWSPPADKQLVLVDMDGTLADVSHRLHHVRGGKRKNWKRFFEEMVSDRPNEVVAEWVRGLEPDYAVIIVSGRPANYGR